MARIKYQAGDAEERDDFTPEERARILTAAREAGPVIRWLNWLSSFNGGRLSELVEADTRDIVMKEGIWVMEIKKTIRIPDQRRKTRVSARDAPLHSALLAEGFLEYVQAIRRNTATVRCSRKSHSTLTAGAMVKSQNRSPNGSATSSGYEIRTNPSIRIATRRRVFFGIPACRMAHPPSKRMWNGICSAIRAKALTPGMASNGSRP
jgi:hypothetical protein